MSAKFRQAFYDTFVKTLCPSKSGYFDSAGQRARSMSMHTAAQWQQHQQNRQAIVNLANRAHYQHDAGGGVGGGGGRTRNLSESGGDDANNNNRDHHHHQAQLPANGRANRITFNCNSVTIASAGGGKCMVARLSEPSILTTNGLSALEPVVCSVDPKT